MSSFQFSSAVNGFQDTMGEFGSDLMNETSVPVASSSKAVLTALRSLQDKIKRLEGERSSVLDESTQLRHQIKNQELELEHLRQRESLAAQKALHEARNAYEKALTEKTETEVRLSKVEDRNRDEQRIAEDLRAKMRSLEEEKHKGQVSMKDLEAQKSHLQSQITYTQQKEKELGQTILWETKRHEEDMDVLGNKLRTLQSELSSVVQEKSMVDTKLLELDHLVGQLLSVNESLVGRLSGKAALAQKTKKVVKRSAPVPVPKSFVPRAASLSTVSFDHSRRSIAGVSAPAKVVATKAIDEADSLHKMHKMYVDLAQSITHDPYDTTTRKPPTTASADADAQYGGMRNPSTVSFGDGTKPKGGDMHGIINTIEQEFAMLNGQYRRLLASVQSQSPSVDSHQAEELVDVIQKLHKKGEQLRALKTPTPTR